MSELNHPRIVFSERLSTGIMVHFEKGISVFFSERFLYDQKDSQSNRVFRENDDLGDRQRG